ncbi:MAG: hypothetical protein RIG62_19620 [Cyclobacteriaceae bacterium]|jgi:hypothetical protein
MLRTDCDYLDTYELNTLRGRNFSCDFKTDEEAIILKQAPAPVPQNYTFRIELGVVVFLLPFLLLLPIVLLTVGSLTIKATRVNPTQALRHE